MLCGLAALALSSVNVSAENVKKILFKQDDAQEVFVSKVYTLKHVATGDILPFIQGAIYRYNSNSKIDKLNYKFAKKQMLVVSTPPAMMKYVDDMIEKLDRPCTKKDAAGSIIEGTGIYRFAYMPKHRGTTQMLNLINNAIISGDGYAFLDSVSNMLYWKDSLSDGSEVMDWAKEFDRPVPQVELSFKVYQVRQSVLDDIGLDYLAWKNGPGLNMLSVGFDSIAMEITEQALSNMDKYAGWSYGGFFVAPQFDMSFIRLLSQGGNAKIAATGALTMVNNYNGSYYVNISPQDQNIVKDGSNDKTSVIATTSPTDFKVTITSPTINFKRKGEVDTFYNGNGFDYNTYSTLGGSVIFGYNVIMKTVVERNNRGDELADSSNVASSLTLDLGNESLLAVYNNEMKVEQTIGVPFLCEIPVLKYIFGATTTIKEDTKFFVTVQGRLVHPEDQYAAWTGKLISQDELKKK